jgi:signal transduction histidine kinase/CheY-like chemotaxis protein
VQPYLASLIAIAAVGIYAALHHGWIWLRRRDLLVHREYALLAVLVALASAAEAWLQTATGDPALRTADTLVWVLHLSEGLALVRFVQRCSAPASRLVPRVLQAMLATFALLAVVLPNGFMTSAERRVDVLVLPWGEPIRFLLGDPSWLYWVVSASAVACIGWCLGAAWKAWRSGGGGLQLALLASLALIAAAIANSLIADICGHAAVPMINHSWALLALVMGHVLTAAVLRQAELEERLRRAERHEQLGRLAAGVAHDFGNLLTGVVGNAELLADELADRPAARDRAQDIAIAGLAASTLTRRMLALARGRDRAPAAVEIGELLAQVAALAASRGQAVRPEIRLQLATPEARVEGDQAQLLSLFLNLVLNARDALGPKGGSITLSTALRGPPPEAALRNRPRNGALLEVAVADTGSGIPPEVLGRLFEPYFTTKGASGTGLGLIQVDEAVRAHGGALAVESRPGAGTTFRVWLPLAVDSSVHEAQHAPAGGRVLVVADESSVLQLTEAALAALGWEVVGVRSRDALRVGGGQRLTAVVIDLPPDRIDAVLPQLRQLLPGLPMVVVGGKGAAPATCFLPRPARTADIAEALAGLLAGR